MNAKPPQVSRKPVIVSALSPDQRWDGGLAGYEAYRGLQSLFGWDAQLKMFGALLKRLGIPCFVTPAPEMFFTPAAMKLLAPRVGADAGDLARAVHVRFGGARFGRILRGIPNLLANAETAWNGILAPGEHPFRGHNVAPHAIAAALDLAGGAAPLFRPDGSEVERRGVPAALIHADLPDWIALERDRASFDPADLQGLEIHSLGEFDARNWSEGKTAPPSLSVRRIALEFNAGKYATARKTPGRPAILLPWNLANPASCVPDLAVKYLRTVSGTDQAGYVILLPFNATGPVADQLNPLIEGIKQRLAELVSNSEEYAAADTSALQLYVARITDLAGVAVLHRMRAVGWIDGLDPEAAWTRARLEACGLAALTLRPAGDPAVDGEAAVLEKAATVEVRGEFGRLFYRSCSASWRGIEQLIAMTRAVDAKAVKRKTSASHAKDDEELLKVVQKICFS